jgi:hypothetical protein
VTGPARRHPRPGTGTATAAGHRPAPGRNPAAGRARPLPRTAVPSAPRGRSAGRTRPGAPAVRCGPRLRRARTGADRGQAAVEYAGVIGLLLFVALAAIQLGLVAYTAQQAGTAARAAARAASTEDGGDVRRAGLGSMSGWLADGAAVAPGECSGGDDEVTVTVRVRVPEILPVFGFDPAVRTVTMPCD